MLPEQLRLTDGTIVKQCPTDKPLYCSRDGRFFSVHNAVLTDDGWTLRQIKPNWNQAMANFKGGSCHPQLPHYVPHMCHTIVALTWLGPRPICGAPNATCKGCGGEEPRHASPLCRLSGSPQASCSGVTLAASDATALPKAQIDHLNGNILDFSADNLQYVTPAENRRRARILQRLRASGTDPCTLSRPQLLSIFDGETCSFFNKPTC